SDDRGATWTVLPAPDVEASNPIALAFVDRDHGFVTANRFWRTADGGVTSSDVTSALTATSTESLGVAGVSAASGQVVAVGMEFFRGDDGRLADRALIVTSSDGGDTWSRREITTSGSRGHSLRSVCLHPSGEGLAVGSLICIDPGLGCGGGDYGSL